MSTKRGLGKGLGALLPGVDEVEREATQEIELSRIRPNAEQPRQVFDPEKLEELAASIREHGIVQPIVLRQVGKEYEIVAGERRWRAARLAGLEKVPAIVREFTGTQVMEIALIENIQREDLNPLEEAQAYRRLLDEFGMTQEQLAKRLGKSRPQVSNTLRLLQLQPEVQEQVTRGELSMGHAKVILSLENPGVQSELARRVAERKLSVRETEEAARTLVPQPVGPGPLRPAERRAEAGVGGRTAAGTAGAGAKATAKTPEMFAVESDLRARLGTPVAIHAGQAKGTIEISYFGEEDLTRLVELLLGRDVPRGTAEGGEPN